VTSRRTQTIVPYSAEEMFDLVADVEKYPEFLPHCLALRVTSERLVEGSGALEADMIVAYGAFRERFRTRVDLDRPARRIDVDYVEGPFRRLRTHWRFHELPDGSEIDFVIDFEFRSLILQAAASSVFERLFARMSDAFVKRAHAVHGGPPSR
jgi:coenzyme Q-binding protein COQ10